MCSKVTGIELGRRAIFDNCSQQSIIRSSLQEQLKLPSVRRDLVVVKTFGSEEGVLQQLDIVVVRVRTRDEKNPIVKCWLYH